MTAFETETNGIVPVPVIDSDGLTSKTVPVEITNATEEEWVYPWPTDFKLSEHFIDDVPTLKVCVIGAGLAGITAGVLLPVKVPGVFLYRGWDRHYADDGTI